MKKKLTENKTDNEKLCQVSRMYKDICRASYTGSCWGISVKELRDKYRLKKRDIAVLINFFTNYDIVNDAVVYLIYRFVEGEKIPDRETKFEDLDVDSYQEVFEEEDIADDCFIRIRDYFFIIQEKIDGESIDVTNVSFVKGMEGQIHDLWDSVSAVKLKPEYIVNKKGNPKIPEHSIEHKKDWVDAIVNCRSVEMKYSISGGKMKESQVIPLGLYYDKFLEEYNCVYESGSGEILEIELNQIRDITVLEECHETESAFRIDEYIKSGQACKMVLKVYHEAKVFFKLKDLLADNQLQIIEHDDYDIFQFMTRDPWKYLRIINGFGKSVVVQEPDYIRDSVLSAAKEALLYYEQEG